MKNIFITTGNGMFGRAVIQELAGNENVRMRIMVRDRSKFNVEIPNAEIVTGDMDRPESLEPLLKDIDSVFLTSPIDEHIATREINVINAAVKHGKPHMVKIGGAVRHEGDDLARMHGKAISRLNEAGLPLTMVSPNSVMETSLMNYVPSIKFMRAIFGMSGNGRIGLVALKDIAVLTAHVLSTPGHEGQNYELTGPEAIDLYEVASRFTQVLGKKIKYYDLSEENFSRMIRKFDKTMTDERLELEILCHLRAWREGRASLVTGTFEQITGRKPTSVDDFIRENLHLFTKNMTPSFFAALIRKSIPGI